MEIMAHFIKRRQGGKSTSFRFQEVSVPIIVYQGRYNNKILNGDFLARYQQSESNEKGIYRQSSK